MDIFFGCNIYSKLICLCVRVRKEEMLFFLQHSIQLKLVGDILAKDDEKGKFTRLVG